MHHPIIITAINVIFGIRVCTSAASPNHSVVLISMDGFRHEYLDWYANETSFLHELADNGVFAKSIPSTFVTQTFPTHWTLATGCYEETHGIVANRMFDPILNATFTKRSKEEFWWNATLPIWLLAKKAGLKTATYYWPGSEVQIRGLEQDYWNDYDQSVPFPQRVDTVADWIVNKSVSFAAMYLHEPDYAGHDFGPRSEEVRQAVKLVDDTIRSLVMKLRNAGFGDKVNYVIVSDHGKSASNESRIIKFNDSMNHLISRVFNTDGTLLMNAKAGKQDELYQLLTKAVNDRKLPMKVYKRDTLPQRFHYNNNRRIADIIAILQDTWSVQIEDFTWGTIKKGVHGYDNTINSMRIPFIAYGPDLPRGRQMENWQQVDVYGLLCRLLRIQPGNYDGSESRVNDVLGTKAVATQGASLMLTAVVLLVMMLAKDAVVM